MIYHATSEIAHGLKPSREMNDFFHKHLDKHLHKHLDKWHSETGYVFYW